MPKSISKILSNEYSFAILTRIFSIFITVAQSICVARYLGPALKGESAYINIIVATGGIIITFGIHEAYPYFKKKLQDNTFLSRYISLVYLIYGIYFTLSLALCFWFPTADIQAAILLMPLAGYARVVNYVHLVENPNKRNITTLSISFITLIISIILIILTSANFYWMILLLMITHLLQAIIFTYLLRCKPIYDKTSLGLAKELFRFGFFPMIALLMTTLNYKVDILMLKQYNYITYAMIGVYSLGIGLVDIIVIIPDTLKGVLVSKLSKGAATNEVAKVCRCCMASSIILFFIILILGRWAIRLLYGELYINAYEVVIITAIGIIFIGYFKLIAQYNIVNGKQIRNVVLLSAAVVTNAIGNLLLVPRLGINGAAVATSLGNSVCGILFVISFTRETHTPIKDMVLIKKSDLSLLRNMVVKKQQ